MEEGTDQKGTESTGQMEDESQYGGGDRPEGYRVYRTNGR